MKKYFKELVILFVQLLIFYLFPILMKNNEPMVMVFMMLFTTIILSMILTFLSKSKLKFLYPIIISLLFVPSVFIFYNESALILSLWYFIVSIVSMIVCEFCKFIFSKASKNGKLLLLICGLLSISIVFFINIKSFFWTYVGGESSINVSDYGVSLSVVDKTLSNIGGTFILKNDNKNEIIFYEPYELEIKKDGQWHEITIQIDFIEIANVLKSQDSYEIEINWEETYGELPKGEYRLIKEISVLNENGSFENSYVSVEFTL